MEAENARTMMQTHACRLPSERDVLHLLQKIMAAAAVAVAGEAG
jgi:hypothetical protein